MARVFAAFADGWGRVLRAPAILLGVFAVTWLVAFPAGRILEHSGWGFSGGYLGLIEGLPTGFYPTFTPTLLGTEAFVRHASNFLTRGTPDIAFLAAAATTLLVWTFLLGGILDRYARRRPIRAQAFFGVSGVFFFRFLRLGVIATLGYFVLFGAVHPLLFPPLYPWVSGADGAAGASPLLTSALRRLPSVPRLLERRDRLRPHPRRRGGPTKHAGRAARGLAVRRRLIRCRRSVCTS